MLKGFIKRKVKSLRLAVRKVWLLSLRATTKGELKINAKELAIYCARAADSKKAEEIMVIDVSEISSVTSYFILCTGRIDKHVRAVADEIEERLEGKKIKCYHRDKGGDSRWIVLDYLDVIVHIFDPPLRDYYKLETLWGDGEEVVWR